MYVCANAKITCIDPTTPLSRTASPAAHFAFVYASAVDRVTAETACNFLVKVFLLDDRPETFPTAVLDESVLGEVTDEERSEQCTAGSKLAALVSLEAA